MLAFSALGFFFLEAVCLTFLTNQIPYVKLFNMRLAIITTVFVALGLSLPMSAHVERGLLVSFLFFSAVFVFLSNHY